ncbi:MAG: biotin--[acetyl-CoA-carboxylase] ligase [Actinomycetota bacterium]
MRAVPETGSTNADLLAEGAAGAPDRTVLRADHQTAGRGRLDRTWEAPPGANLLVSFLFRSVPGDPHVLTQAVAMAARDVAREHGVDAVMKWPNDLLVGTAKIAGVLAQAGPLGSDGRPSFVVVGIGVNIAAAPDGAACMADSGCTALPSPHEFLLSMLPVLDRLLSLGANQMHAAYRGGLATIGTKVRAVLPGGGELTGRAVDVERDGRLVVIDECAVTHRIDTADVVHLRPAP